MNTEVKARLNQDIFMKCIKKELRNIEISCLIIDLLIFDREEAIDYSQAIEAFSLLNPGCKIIVMYEDESGMKDLISSIQQCPGIHIIESKENNNVIIDIINSVVVNYDMDDVPDSDIPDSDIPEDVIPEGDIPDGVISDTQEEIIKEEYKEVSETPLIHEIHPPDNIFNKATVPVKLSEGEPLRKRAKKISEGEQHNQSDTMKLSTKVKRQHKNDNSTKPGTPILQDEHIWNCSNVMIGIVGAERRTGTTTTALHLATYLKELGASVIYTEANQHGHIDDIAVQYSLTLSEDHYINDKVLYYRNSQFDQDAGANFIIFDLGYIEENKQRTLKILTEIMNEIIIVSGCKPYEQNALNQAIMTIDNKDVNIVLNLASQAELESLQGRYKDNIKYSATAPYEPSLIQPGHWPDDFMELFLQYRLKQQAVS
jgi:hypothetical protein